MRRERTRIEFEKGTGGPIWTKPAKSPPVISSFLVEEIPFNCLPETPHTELNSINAIGSVPSVGHSFSRLPMVRPQAKLTLSQPGDAYEEEAGRVADLVVSTPEPAFLPQSEVGIYSAKPQEQSQREHAERAESKPNANLTQAEEREGSPISEASLVAEATQTPGYPLDAVTKAFMEPRFGFDFSEVRIHSDAQAMNAAESMNASAFTLGNDISFSRGQYLPDTSEGRHLLAHELTHVVQQARSTPPSDRIFRDPQTDAATPPSSSTTAAATAVPAAVSSTQADVPASPTVPKPGAYRQEFQGVLVSDDRDFMKAELQRLVAQRGLDGADEWRARFLGLRLTIPPPVPLGHLHATGALRPHYPWDAQRERRDEIIKEGVSNLYTKEVRPEALYFLAEFESEARIVLGDTLTDSETRAKAEGIKYGLTEKQMEETFWDWETGEHTATWTSYDFRDPNSPAVTGVGEAARQLLERRRTKVAPVKKRLDELNLSHVHSMPPAGGFYNFPKSSELVAAEKEFADEERSYDVLANDMAQRYPIIGSFTRDKENLGGLQRLAAGGTHDAAQLIGAKIAETLGKIKRVRDENKPGGDANPFKIPKIVALTKGRKTIAEGSWQNKIVDEHVDDINTTSLITDIAIGLTQLALVLLAPATGGASLVLAAGLSTAVAVDHAKEYMLEEAMAGTDVDRARALSQDDPSLFWLAVDIVGAVTDVGAGAAAAAKLMNTWRTASKAVRAVEAAKTADELAVARKAMAEALEHEPELLARMTKSIDQDGRLVKVSDEVKAVDEAVEKAAAAELKGLDVPTSGGHVTDTGRVFSCHSPCTEIRAKYSELLASEEGKGLLGDLTKLEDDAARAVAEGKKGADLAPLKERAKALDNALGQAMTQVRATKIAGWLETMQDTYPALKEHRLDVAAVERIIRKTNPDHIKGQLLEELMGAKLQKMIASGDKGLEALAGGRPIEKLEYIAGHRIKDARGKQFTDGMLIVRDGDKVEVVAVIESKAGKSASAGLAGEYSSLRQDGTYKSLKELGAGLPEAKLSEAEEALIEARRHAIEQLRKANRSKYKGLTIEAIDEAAEHQAAIAKVMDKMVKTEAGQAVQDIERMVSVGFKIDDVPVKLAGAGRSGLKSTKVVGVLPDDLSGKALEAKIGAGTKKKPGQGVNFTTQTVGIESAELNSLADEIATRATAPAL